MLALGQSDAAAFLLMDGDVALGQGFPESSVHGLEAPSMRRIGLPQEPEVISTPSLGEGGRSATGGDLCGPLPPPIHPSERQLTA